MKRLFLILIWVLNSGCDTDLVPEIGNCQTELERYTVDPGQFAARPARTYTHHGRPAGAWQVVLENGWDYILPRNQKQWLKICGDALTFEQDNPEAVMLAARYDGEKIQVTPYYNKNGYSYYPERYAQNDTWPVYTITTNDTIYFSYEARDTTFNIYPGKDTTVTNLYTTLQINNPPKMRARHLFGPHPAMANNFVREINFYAGGSVPTVDFLTLYKRRLCQ